jgi:hypothetical protein
MGHQLRAGKAVLAGDRDSKIWQLLLQFRQFKIQIELDSTSSLIDESCDSQSGKTIPRQV